MPVKPQPITKVKGVPTVNTHHVGGLAQAPQVFAKIKYGNVTHMDFVAKFLRRSLLNFIGRFNISQGFLDTLSQVLEGLLAFLADAGVLTGSKIERIIQDENNPDSVLITIKVDVPYPCNFLRITLVL